MKEIKSIIIYESTMSTNTYPLVLEKVVMNKESLVRRKDGK